MRRLSVKSCAKTAQSSLCSPHQKEDNFFPATQHGKYRHSFVYEACQGLKATHNPQGLLPKNTVALH